MHFINLFFIALIVFVVGLFATAHGRKAMRSFTHQLAVNALGTRGSAPFLTDAAWTKPGLLVMLGTDTSHVDLCDGSKPPIGSTSDTPASGDRVTVNYLGKSLDAQTRIAYASGAVTIGGDAYVDNANPGQLTTEPATAGVYYKVGKFGSTTAGAGPVVLIDEPHSKLTVTAASGVTTVAGVLAIFADAGKHKFV